MPLVIPQVPGGTPWHESDGGAREDISHVWSSCWGQAVHYLVAQRVCFRNLKQGSPCRSEAPPYLPFVGNSCISRVRGKHSVMPLTSEVGLSGFFVVEVVGFCFVLFFCFWLLLRLFPYTWPLSESAHWAGCRWNQFCPQVIKQDSTCKTDQLTP